MERWTYRKCLPLFCYGDEENARIYAVHLTTADQSEIRRAYLVSVPAYRLSIYKMWHN